MYTETGLVEHHTLTALVDIHDRAIAKAKEGLAALQESVDLLSNVFGYSGRIFPEHRITESDFKRAEQTLPKCSENIKEQFWQYVLTKCGIRDAMSPKDRERLEEMFKNHTTPPFDVENIQATLGGLYENRQEIFSEAIKWTFDRLRPPSWNRKHKTNKPWIIGKKIIMEGMIYSYGVNYYKQDVLTELDKCMWMLDGKGLPEYSKTLRSMIQSGLRDRDDSAENDYYKVRWYIGAGTVHITFKRPDLVQKLNEIGAAGARVVG